MDEPVSVEAFHRLCHDLAKDYCDRGGRIPEGLTQHDLGQTIKSLLLRKLPSEYVEFGPTQQPLGSDGTFDFVKPVPYGVLLKAAKAADVVSDDRPQAGGASEPAV